MLRFRNADLRPVVAEATANKCALLLVKDQGVYFMASIGARTPEGRQKFLAYAVGCNPDADDFDAWWDLAHTELGGDDFGENFDVQDGVFQRILNSNDDLQLSATKKHLSIVTVPPSAA